MFKMLVFAMLSSASGWGLPSHDPPLSSNESTGGVDGARVRRQLQLLPGNPPGTSCNGNWSVLRPTPDLSPPSPLTLPLPSCPQRENPRNLV